VEDIVDTTATWTDSTAIQGTWHNPGRDSPTSLLRPHPSIGPTTHRSMPLVQCRTTDHPLRLRTDTRLSQQPHSRMAQRRIMDATKVREPLLDTRPMLDMHRHPQ